MVDKMLILLEQKNQCLDEFLKLTQYQNQAILNENFDELSNLVENKNRLIKIISLIDKQFLTIFEEIKKQKKVETFDQIDDIDFEIKTNIKNVTSIIMEKLTIIKELDEKNTVLIKSKYEDLKKNISKVQYNKKAINQYYEQKRFGPSIFDKKE